jgi:nucleoside-diphosphate-sugar epimerase
LSCVVITGGDGYLGREVALRYLCSTDLEVVLAVRASHAAELAAKRASLGPLAGRVRPVAADLAGDDPLAGVDRRAVSHLVHAGAVTRFNVDRETARRVNLEGTVKVLEFAERCPRLERVSVLSTLYSGGLRPGPLPESPIDADCAFANHYEWSKHEAERAVVERFGALPWQLVRVATVISHDERGVVEQFNAFHNTLKLYYYGMLSLLPGDPCTPLYFVTGRFAADAVVSLATAAEGGVFHVSHPYEYAVTLEELIDVAFERFERDESFRRRRVLRPVYADRAAFEIFAGGVGAFAGEAVAQAVASVTPFAPQLYVHKQVATDRLRAALGEPAPPGPAELARRTCDFLVTTRWGRDRRVA